MDVKSEIKVRVMHKERRIELGCTLMILKSQNKVCGMEKKNRMEVRCTK